MKNYVDVIGIEVSKLTIDAHIHKIGSHRLFMNNTKGFVQLLSWSKKELGLASVFYSFLTEILFKMVKNKICIDKQPHLVVDQ